MTKTRRTTTDAATADGRWSPDLLEGFERLSIDLPGPRLSDDEPLSATLVRRTLDADPDRDRRSRAVLSLPGWNDYFFHAHVAEFYAAQGITLYALDPRRAGRSLHDPQFRDYVTDLGDYATELDAAARLIRERHQSLIVMAHSTGGLVASLWAAQRPELVDGLVLNSPWLAMWGFPGYGTALMPPISVLSRQNPLRIIPLADPGDRYASCIHASLRGEYDYDLELKAVGSVPVRSGWLRAVLRGHRTLSRGLGIEAPVFVGLSTRSFLRARAWSKRAATSDIVLDVENLAAKAHKLGSCVTVVRIPQGFHDLTLSVPEARERFFAELARWLAAYVPERTPAEVAPA